MIGEDEARQIEEGIDGEIDEDDLDDDDLMKEVVKRQKESPEKDKVSQ